GLKNQSQNMTAEYVAVSNDTMTLFVKGIADAPGTVPDVVGMGASDAVYLLEKEGLTTNINGFGRVFRQSLKPGMPIVNGETISLELGFDKLEIMKRDSIKARIFIQEEQLGLVQEGDSAKVVKVEEAKPKASKTPAEKPKPSQEAIDKWKAKVAAQKELEKKNAAEGKTEKPKPSQEAIDKWKAKVAAQKALDAKNADAKKTE
ncbi:MAG: PASTA domain-containing protein, partial [Bacteroidota bacterium]|nr:PASTA domain-containing protein [Bacteroidota bacterium]